MLHEVFVGIITSPSARDPRKGPEAAQVNQRRASLRIEDAPLRSGFQPKRPPKPVVAGFRRRGLVTDHRILGKSEQSSSELELQSKQSLQSTRLNAPFEISKPRPLWMDPNQHEEQDGSSAGGTCDEVPTRVSSKSLEILRSHSQKLDSGPHTQSLDSLFSGRRLRPPSLNTEVDGVTPEVESASASATQASHCESVIMGTPRMRSVDGVTPGVDSASASATQVALSSGVEEEAASQSGVEEEVHAAPENSTRQISEHGTQTDEFQRTSAFVQANVAPAGGAGLWGQQQQPSGRTVTVHLLNRAEVDFSRWTPADDGRNKKTPHLQYLEVAKARFPGALEAAARASAKTSRVSLCREAVAQSHPLGRRSRRQHDL